MRERSRLKLGCEASWSRDTHPNSGLAVQAGGSLCGYGGMSDMNKAGLVPDEHCYWDRLMAGLQQLNYTVTVGFAKVSPGI